ncbi:hypothetical protein [Dactylosporangium sp. NPDC049140]|uniref:hypothetical protein n=1 Tax=Dactylosporangium sp. NPDC049140 TaxID=3155647 RepID=UPI0033E09ACA
MFAADEPVCEDSVRAFDPSPIEPQDVTMSETATSDDAALNAGPGRRWIWAFHLIAVAVAGAVLWSLSYPGSHFFLLAAGGLAAFAVGSFWLAWTIAVAITTRRTPAARRCRRP